MPIFKIVTIDESSHEINVINIPLSKWLLSKWMIPSVTHCYVMLHVID